MPDFIISFNSDVIISAAVSGRIGAGGDVSHIDSADSRGLLNKIRLLTDADINIGYISGRAEGEARHNISSAINAVLNIHWRKNSTSDEEREKLADAIDIFRKEVSSKLDSYIFMLNRETVSKKQLDRYIKNLKQEFGKLQEKYLNMKKYYDEKDGVVKAKGIEVKELKEFEPDIKDGDIEIIAEAILVRVKDQKIKYLAAIDKHITLNWATDMLEKKFGLLTRKPDSLIHIVQKRYKHIIK